MASLVFRNGRKMRLVTLHENFISQSTDSHVSLSVAVEARLAGEASRCLEGSHHIKGELPSDTELLENVKQNCDVVQSPKDGKILFQVFLLDQKLLNIRDVVARELCAKTNWRVDTVQSLEESYFSSERSDIAFVMRVSPFSVTPHHDSSAIPWRLQQVKLNYSLKDRANTEPILPSVISSSVSRELSLWLRGTFPSVFCADFAESIHRETLYDRDISQSIASIVARCRSGDGAPVSRDALERYYRVCLQNIARRRILAANRTEAVSQPTNFDAILAMPELEMPSSQSSIKLESFASSDNDLDSISDLANFLTSSDTLYELLLPSSEFSEP